MNNILIVDDDEQVRDLLRIIFIAEGYHVSLVTNGLEVLPWLADHPVDVIVLDIMMDGASGFDVLAVLPYPRPPILVLTALSDDETEQHALAAGAAKVLCKPFAVVELIHAVRDLLVDAQADRWRPDLQG